MPLSDKLKIPKWKPNPKILLGEQIPKPMSGVNPRTILGQAWWDKERKAAYEKTAHHCAACGIWKLQAKGRQHLEAHEQYRIDYARGRMYYLGAVALCHYCHAFIHVGRLQALMEKGEISQQQYVAVIQHGNRVLAAAELVKPPVYNGRIAPWSKWRLILNRKHYPPLYRDYWAWAKAMGVGGEVTYDDEQDH